MKLTSKEETDILNKRVENLEKKVELLSKSGKKKKTKRRTKEQILLDRHNEKKAELKKAIKKQKDFLNHKFGD